MAAPAAVPPMPRNIRPAPAARIFLPLDSSSSARSRVEGVAEILGIESSSLAADPVACARATAGAPTPMMTAIATTLLAEHIVKPHCPRAQALVGPIL